MQCDIRWDEGTRQLREALEAGGAFLIAIDDRGTANPMTIGWGQLGIVWSRPVFTVLVRISRHTHGCLHSGGSFAVSVPRPGELKDELLFCGTRSGREIDKIEACGLATAAGREIDAPVLAACSLHYECRILARTQQQRSDFASTDLLDDVYPHDDHHLIVFGEIVAAYRTDG